MPAYCEHFEYLKPNDNLTHPREAACHYCFQTATNLWICMAVHLWAFRRAVRFMCAGRTDWSTCGRTCKVAVGVGRVSEEQEVPQYFYKRGDGGDKMRSLRNRNLRPRHVPIHTPSPYNLRSKAKQDPFPYRLKILPGLQDLTSHKSKHGNIKLWGSWRTQWGTGR